VKPLRHLPDFRVVTAVAAGALLLLTVGCGEGVRNSGEDDDFIRVPGATVPAAVKTGSGPLLPTKAGSSWRNVISIRRIAGPANGNQDPNVDDNGNPFRKLYEQSTLSAAGFSSAKNSGDIRIDMRQEGQSGSNRSETYTVNKRGIFLSRVTGDLSLTTLPPLPIVSYPLREDEIKVWRGTVRIGNKSYPAEGYSRVGSTEEISLAQGKVQARRVDTIITATVDGRPTSFPMKRWFAPGIGMVRQKFVSGNLEITKDLVRYKI
jgi:hypothetical protein